MRPTRSQTATEYLIIIAVVIIIALIVVVVMSGLPGIGGGASASALSAYWKSNGQLGVEAISISESTIKNDSITFKNLNSFPIRVDSIMVGPLNNLTSLNISSTILTAGESLAFTKTSIPQIQDKFASCIAGTTYTLYLSVNYTDVVTLAEYTFTGAGNALQGTCAN
jgi:hypothetical protein